MSTIIRDEDGSILVKHHNYEVSMSLWRDKLITAIYKQFEEFPKTEIEFLKMIKDAEYSGSSWTWYLDESDLPLRVEIIIQ